MLKYIMKKRYFAFTIKDDRSQITLARLVKRAAYGVFEDLIVSVESKPFQHMHVLAATRSANPNIERFFQRCPPITWAKELDAQKDFQQFQPYILAQDKHAEKNCGTIPLLFKGSVP